MRAETLTQAEREGLAKQLRRFITSTSNYDEDDKNSLRRIVARWADYGFIAIHDADEQNAFRLLLEQATS